jgi:hypothetical protein
MRAVQASGSGRSWATGTTPPSALLGYVQSFTFTSAQNVVTISERGVPDHHKVAAKTPIDLNVNYLWTGGGLTALTASGASMPLYHMEYRASAPEIGNGTTGFYYQFMGAALVQAQLTEQAEGTVIAAQYRCLAMVGSTGSGYLG